MSYLFEKQVTPAELGVIRAAAAKKTKGKKK
jgi:hypothetical protein